MQKLNVVVEHLVDREETLIARPTGLPKRSRAGGLRSELVESECEQTEIGPGDEKSRLAIDHNFSDTSDRSCDNGTSKRHRFDEGDRGCLGPAGETYGVRRDD